MYLKNIEVHGFKSFAQKINFEFQNGITGIVGPNGSGKSNVADAVRWVLGEQSAKQLRGGNMQDVIFSGTEARKPLSFASVAITLDNSDHKLPVEYEEVTVTRRLYRSGESEYLLNGSSCRLKDINEMFYDTGIGKEGYSIIGQGQIDRILSGKAEERRELFDEAAGIVKFKRRKTATLKKLDEEQANLVRVTDILTELTRQLEPLARQSENAKLYLAKREQLKEMDVNLFLLEYERNTKILAELTGKLETATQELSETKLSYEKTKEEYDRLEQELTELNGQIETLRENSQQQALKIQQLTGQMDVMREQISSEERDSDHYRDRLSVIAEDIIKHQSEKEASQKEREALTLLARNGQKDLEAKEQELLQLQGRIASCSRDVEEGQSEIMEILNSRATAKGQSERFDALMEQIDIRKAEISQKILSLKGEEALQTKKMEEADRIYKEITSNIQSMNEEMNRLKKEVDHLQTQLSGQTKTLDVTQQNFHREESRLESLRNMTERYDGYGNAIRRVMEQKSQVPGLKGVVADLIQVDRNYEVAIETALGGSIQNIVTDNEQTAKRMIEFLKKNRYGRATFLPLSNMKGKNEFPNKEALKEKGVLGVASDLVRSEEEYTGLMRQLLGRILVVDHVDHAIQIAGKYRHSFRMVTLEGESLNPGGSMAGGAFKNNSNLLGRRREIEAMERSVEELKRKVIRAQETLDMTREQRNSLRDRIAALQESLRVQYVEQNTAKLNRDALLGKEKELQNSYSQIRQDQNEVKQKLAEIQGDHDRIARVLQDSEKDEHELQDYIQTKQKELEICKEEEAQLLEYLNESRLTVSQGTQKEEFLQENLIRLSQEIQSLQEEQKITEEKLHVSQEAAKQKKQELKSCEQGIWDLEKSETAYREQIQEKQEQVDARKQRHKQFFDQRDELSQRMTLLDKECYRLGSLQEKLEETRDSRINYLWDEYEITPGNAKAFQKEEYRDRSALQKMVSDKKMEIRKLGPVNVNAIEDYKELSERHGFMKEQYEDLQKAADTLKSIILDLDEGMRKQFSEKFQDIQREFDKAFKELFGGGKGTLELEEADDILEAGVRIISQPPGKKLQNMMQLSGGEKALTAIALLFAIQNLKPSPFCLLDEIEAALDDSNVGRFAGYLQKLTKNTQFIIITHRRGTMNAADRLYGITMQEKGVSTLVSVDLVENQLTQ